VAERWIGSCRGELLDHVVVLGERHLVLLVRGYIAYHHEDRTHLGLGKDTPSGRVVASRPSVAAKIVALPRVGGLHHRYEWRKRALGSSGASHVFFGSRDRYGPVQRPTFIRDSSASAPPIKRAVSIASSPFQTADEHGCAFFGETKPDPDLVGAAYKMNARANRLCTSLLTLRAKDVEDRQLRLRATEKETKVETKNRARKRGAAHTQPRRGTWAT
jgi:hypothetical protein